MSTAKPMMWATGSAKTASSRCTPAGHATAAFDDGRVYYLTEGTVFYIPPEPHDSWVVGTDRYVSLHVLGASGYAK